MEEFAADCRELAESRSIKFSSGGRAKSSYTIDSSSAREALVELADNWEAQFGGESGQALWDFVGQHRPAVPRNQKQIQQALAELPQLTARRVEMLRDAASRTPTIGSGIPPGFYQVCLVFGEGEPVPLIVTDIRKASQ